MVRIIFSHSAANPGESVTDGNTCRIMPSLSSGGTTPVTACLNCLASDDRTVLSIRNIYCTGDVRILGGVVAALEEALPDVVADRNKRAYNLVPRFLTETFGERDKGWETKQQPKRDGSGTTPWVYVK